MTDRGFRKYMHIEKYGNDEVEGIELGTCHIFPKLDGTNASVWLGQDGEICSGSRNRQLGLGAEDNAGFNAFVQDDERIKSWFNAHPDLRLYGEWLVPHSLKTYRDDAWREFYIFDVYEDNASRYLPYDEYKPLLEATGLEYIPAISTFKNASYSNLLVECENNGFLIKDGEGAGEGIVIKNYDFVNKFGRICFAKIVRNEFKEKHQRVMGPIEKTGETLVEQKIVDGFLTGAMIDKVVAKIINECEGWNSRYIPRLLGEVYHDLITEEIWDILKKNRYPTIDFKKLQRLVNVKIKSHKSELF